MLKWLVPVGAFAIDLILFYYNYKKLKRSLISNDQFVEVLLFPDEKLYCNAHHFLTTSCRLAKRCKYEHNVNSMVKLLHFLLSANKSVDVCVFNITCFDLADMLIDLRSRKIKVRVVTDSAELTGTQVPKLLNNGVPVRTLMIIAGNLSS